MLICVYCIGETSYSVWCISHHNPGAEPQSAPGGKTVPKNDKTYNAQTVSKVK